MKIPLIEIKAKDLADLLAMDEHVFIFMPKQNRFLLMDGCNVLEKTVLVYFEPSGNPQSWIEVSFPINAELQIAVVKSANLNLDN